MAQTTHLAPPRSKGSGLGETMLAEELAEETNQLYLHLMGGSSEEETLLPLEEGNLKDSGHRSISGGHADPCAELECDASPLYEQQQQQQQQQQQEIDEHDEGNTVAATQEENAITLLAGGAGGLKKWKEVCVYDHPSLIISPLQPGTDIRYGATVKECDFQASVSMFIARCTLTLTFENIHDKDLEAEFVLPLPSEATVTGYSLEFGGQMVPASMVEAKKAEKVYDEEIKKGKEVSIAQKVTAGANLFKTKIHPIPARSTRRLSVTYTQPMDTSIDPEFYILDLNCLKIPRTLSSTPASTNTGGSSFLSSMKRRISLIGRGGTASSSSQPTTFAPISATISVSSGSAPPLFLDGSTGTPIQFSSSSRTEDTGSKESSALEATLTTDSANGTFILSFDTKKSRSCNDDEKDDVPLLPPRSIRVGIPIPKADAPPIILSEVVSTSVVVPTTTTTTTTTTSQVEEKDGLKKPPPAVEVEEEAASSVLYFAINDSSQKVMSEISAQARHTDQPISSASKKGGDNNNRLCVIWDASFSRQDSSTDVELSLLRQILQATTTSGGRGEDSRPSDIPLIINVDLLIVRESVEVHFGIKSADTLLSLLKEAPFDGATNLQALNQILSTNALARYHRVFLFSDGISTLGEGRIRAVEKDADLLPPIYCFCASSPSLALNSSVLEKYWADLTGGTFFLLNRTMKESQLRSIAAAVTNDQHRSPLITRVSVLEKGFIPTSSSRVKCNPSGKRTLRSDDNRFTISGQVQLTASEFRNKGLIVRVAFLHSQTSCTTHKDYVVRIAPPKSGEKKSQKDNSSCRASPLGVVPLLWAQQQISTLEVFPERNAAEVLRVSRQFGILTSSMSLLLLDTLDQHLEHDIEPHPAREDLLKEFQSKRSDQRESEDERVQKKISSVMLLWQGQRTWYEKQTTKQTAKQSTNRPGRPSNRSARCGLSPSSQHAAASASDSQLRDSSSSQGDRQEQQQQFLGAGQTEQSTLDAIHEEKAREITQIEQETRDLHSAYVEFNSLTQEQEVGIDQMSSNICRSERSMDKGNTQLMKATLHRPSLLQRIAHAASGPSRDTTPSSSRVTGDEDGRSNAEAGVTNNNISVKYWSPDLPYMEKIISAGKTAANKLSAIDGSRIGSEACPETSCSTNSGSNSDTDEEQATMEKMILDAEYKAYLVERVAYLRTPSFYFDVAGHFLSGQQAVYHQGHPQSPIAEERRKIGIRILSNIAELGLENSRILRVMGYKLYQAKEWTLAREIFAKVAVLRPTEPQSFRDLGLTFLESGWYQQAINLLWRTVVMPVDHSFSEIELECLWEIRDALYRARQSTDTSPQMMILKLPTLLEVNKTALGLYVPSMDEEGEMSHGAIIRGEESTSAEFPLDLRITLAWDTDNVDIDLHVQQPDGEEAYYGRRNTKIGGKMSRDFTRGYGPESYVLRSGGDSVVSSAGIFTVFAKYFSSHQPSLTGPTVAMVTITTNFLRKNQKSECTLVRLNASREKAEVGSVALEKRCQ